MPQGNRRKPGSARKERGQIVNAMIFAAGLGTRLRPITDTVPKALVEVGGKPLLRHVLDRLGAAGFDNIVVNAHHLARQITDYLADSDVKVSLEKELLDTGGGLRAAMPLFGNDLPVLVHNVDILSNADPGRVYSSLTPGTDASLLVSQRRTSRYLLFDGEMRMVGWTNVQTGEVRSPLGRIDPGDFRMYAFSGIHAVSRTVLPFMEGWPEKFPIMDFYIKHCRDLVIKGFVKEDLEMVDVGKTGSLEKAEEFLSRHGNAV